MSAPAESVAPLSSAAAAQSDAAAASPAEPVSASSGSAIATAPSSSSSTGAAAAAPAPAPGVSSSAAHGHQLEARTVGLSGDQVVYLQLMADRYKLKSIDKAARCLVNYADKDGDHRFIFATYRCRKCGIKFPKKSLSLSLYPWQWSFLDRMKAQFNITDDKNDGKPLRCLLDFTQEGRCKRGMTDAQKAEVLTALEAEMFEKIRCNDPVCTHQH